MSIWFCSAFSSAGLYAPTFLGVLLVIAGLGYAIGGFSVVLFPPGTNVAAYTFVGEVVLIFWLLLRGRRITPVRIGETERRRSRMAVAGWERGHKLRPM